MNLYHNFGVGDNDLDHYMYLFDGDEDDVRDKQWNHKHIDWPLHVKKLIHENILTNVPYVPCRLYLSLCYSTTKIGT